MRTADGRVAGRYASVLLAIALGCVVVALPLAGQTAKPGTLLRVTAPEHREEPCAGRVVGAGDPLVVREADGTLHTIPAEQIELLEVWRTRSVRSREALLGALVGGMVGAAVGVGTYRNPCDGSGDMFCLDFGPALPAFAVGSAGALVGLLVGQYRAPEGWQPLWRREVQAHVALAPAGVGVRVEIRAR
jgi:hypothetical protein